MADDPVEYNYSYILDHPNTFVTLKLFYHDYRN